MVLLRYLDCLTGLVALCLCFDLHNKNELLHVIYRKFKLLIFYTTKILLKLIQNYLKQVMPVNLFVFSSCAVVVHVQSLLLVLPKVKPLFAPP